MKNAKDQFDDELISAYWDDELSPSDRRRVEQMLRDDQQRRRTLEQFQALSENLRSLPNHQLDDSFHARVLERLQADDAAQPTTVVASGLSTGRPGKDAVPQSRKRAQSWQPAAMGLASLAAALLVMFFLTQGVHRPTVARHSPESSGSQPTGTEPSETDESVLALDSVRESPVFDAGIEELTEDDYDALAGRGVVSEAQIQQLAAQTDSDFIVQVAAVSAGEDLSRYLQQNSLVPAPNPPVPQAGFFFLPQLVESKRETLGRYRSLNERSLRNGNRMASADRETRQFFSADQAQPQDQVLLVLAEGTADQVHDAISGLGNQSQWFQPVSVFPVSSRTVDSRGRQRVAEGSDDPIQAVESRPIAPATAARSLGFSKGTSKDGAAVVSELHDRFSEAEELASSPTLSKKLRRSDSSDANMPMPVAPVQLPIDPTKPTTTLAAPKAPVQQQNGDVRRERTLTEQSRELSRGQASQNARDSATRSATTEPDAKITSEKATTDLQLAESLEGRVNAESLGQIRDKSLLGEKQKASAKLRILFLVLSPDSTTTGDGQASEPATGSLNENQ